MDDVLIDVPMVLVSQVPRSGGSLLAQLFDGHPQVYAHPFELRIWPRKWEWPELDPSGDPRGWFDVLGDEKWARFARDGLAKAGGNPHAERERHPFTYSEPEQRELFLELVASHPIRRQRDILDCWFTSFFRSWGEWRPTGEERVLTGFLPTVATLPESRAAFRRDYPDGKLISIVRDPRFWWASNSRRRSHGESISEAIVEWTDSATALAELVRAGEPDTLGVVFEDLVLEPERVMRRVAAFAGIDFDDCLLEPTYAGRPVLPNSSFSVAKHGINAKMASRPKKVPREVEALIAVEALPLYEELVGLIGLRAGSTAGR